MKCIKNMILTLAILIANVNHAGDYQMVFTDSDNNVVKIHTLPKRIAGLVYTSPMLYYAVVGNMDYIITMQPRAKRLLDFYSIFKKDLKNMYLSKDLDGTLGNGSTTNIEQLVKLKTDFAIQWSTRGGVFLKPIKNVGIPVMGWGCCTKRQRLDYLNMIGYITGRMDKAQAIINMHINSEKMLISKKAQRNIKNKPTLIEVSNAKGNAISVLTNTSNDFIIANVIDQAKILGGKWSKSVNIEELYQWNPKIILLSLNSSLKPKDLYNNKSFKHLDAIKNKAVYKIPLFNKSYSSPEVFLTLEWVNALAYPNTSGKKFRSRIKQVYQDIFKANLTDKMIDEILMMNDNKHSKNYKRLFG